MGQGYLAGIDRGTAWDSKEIKVSWLGAYVNIQRKERKETKEGIT